MAIQLSVAALGALALLAGRSEAASHPTLEGMTVWGYQGWYTGNWKWFSPENIVAGPPSGDQKVLTDYIPYVLDYPQECREPTDFVLADSTKASWFYSNCSAVVEQHFKYMQQYKIDGIFVQRFRDASNPSNEYYHQGVQVLDWVRQYAEQYGKYFAVEYDFSALQAGENPDDYLGYWKNDFDKVVAPLFQSSSYIYQDGKPVMEIWGAGFNDNKGGSGQDYQTLVDYMANSATPTWNILGVPWYWQDLNDQNRSPPPAPGLFSLYQSSSVQCLQPWGVGAYSTPDDFAYYFQNRLVPMKSQLDGWGKKLSPVIHPGTQNYNSNKQSPIHNTRFNTTLLQYGMGNVSQPSLKPHFIFGAMFDEYTEGSQLLPALKWTDLPHNPNPGFEGQDDNKDYFVYMEIAGNWTAAFHRTWGQQPLSN